MNRSKKENRWDEIGIHQLMIQDKRRTLCYKKAIENNVKNNDVVLDVGCGTGILSFFAAKKGCKKIYAVDKSNIIECAIEIAKRNDLKKYIQFIKTDILEFEPKEKIDVLIHELIGSFIWDENVLSKVSYIRDHFLKKGGIIIPHKIELYFVPVNYRLAFEKAISFWSKKRYGTDFSYLSQKEFIQSIETATSPSIINLNDTKTFLCKEKLAYTIDLIKEATIAHEITAAFKIEKNSRLTGVLVYFKVFLDKNNVVSTKPKKTNTHWGQILIPCLENKIVKRNSVLNFTLFPKKKERKWRFKFELV